MKKVIFTLGTVLLFQSTYTAADQPTRRYTNQAISLISSYEPLAARNGKTKITLERPFSAHQIPDHQVFREKLNFRSEKNITVIKVRNGNRGIFIYYLHNKKPRCCHIDEKTQERWWSSVDQEACQECQALGDRVLQSDCRECCVVC